MASEGKVILSYHDVLLRESDVATLNPNQWLNDQIISFWFEYLLREVYSSFANKIHFMPPEMVQLIRAAAGDNMSPNEVDSVLGISQLMNKKVVFFAINDSSINTTSVGGHHWSLLVLFPESSQFVHYDSINDSGNEGSALEVIKVMVHIIPSLKTNLIQGACEAQNNSSDCGIHVLINCQAICESLFSPNNGKNAIITEISPKFNLKSMRKDILQTIAKLSH